MVSLRCLDESHAPRLHGVRAERGRGKIRILGSAGRKAEKPGPEISRHA